MLTKEEIKLKAKPVLIRYGVLKASLFGSTARGENNENSDIDLLIQFGDDKTLLDLVSLKLELEKILKSNIDLLTFDSINPRLKKEILEDQEVIYA